MNQSKKPKIFVVGNEKGGAGKTTCSMHLIIGLLDRGYNIASIDTDSRQHSLTRYINNRKEYNNKNPQQKVDMPLHFHLQGVEHEVLAEKEKQEKIQFEQAFNVAQNHADYIVIDTPGSYTNLSRIAHSYADTVITPINDSFIDLDVIAKVDSNDLGAFKPSIYSQMLWEQKMERAARDQGSIDWVVVRNRLSSLDAQNKRNMADALEKISKRIAFRIVPGFSERVIFRELFLHGLTLLDLNKANYTKTLNLSHVAARQEIRSFLDSLKV
ncbi:MAG: division plane positioning ATPase MipZ [Rickettsiaceae bacterium]|nr:division plane positioning ATPase MipZ [Rickettsiaceae bacterium]MDP4832429.1 division plane positioning ATPase MipZ [Rickettsiaceae bacterium]MDP5020158.1 division plane positioning ATPase MipZ [Rickettsiaceae bacterium]MDP5082744.1 division plane positioning ATPase MipZ [Rickettsiaceae bacterium]